MISSISSRISGEALPAALESRPRWLEVVSHVDPKFGGITAAVPDLSGALESAGIDIEAVAFCGVDEQAPPTWRRTPERYPTGRRRWMLDRELRRRFEKRIGEAAGLHIHGIWREHCDVAARTARSMRKPYVISAHGMLERWAVGRKAWKKRIYSALIENNNLGRAACLHALTDAEAEDYRREGFRNPVAVIPNGIHLPSPAPPHLFLDRFPHLRDRRIVLFLSRIHPKKGLDILVDAWARVRLENADLHLVIAGPDFEGTQKEIENRISGLAMADRVTFTGMLTGEMKWSALAAAEVYVLPSYSEGFSVAILEAMATGRPVIITRQCNFPEVAGAQCGWQIEPDARALEQSLGEALSASPEQREAHGRRGRDLVASKFTWPVVGEQMASVYRWLSGGPRPAGVRLV